MMNLTMKKASSFTVAFTLVLTGCMYPGDSGAGWIFPMQIN